MAKLEFQLDLVDTERKEKLISVKKDIALGVKEFHIVFVDNLVSTSDLLLTLCKLEKLTLNGKSVNVNLKRKIINWLI